MKLDQEDRDASEKLLGHDVSNRSHESMQRLFSPFRQANNASIEWCSPLWSQPCSPVPSDHSWVTLSQFPNILKCVTGSKKCVFPYIDSMCLLWSFLWLAYQHRSKSDGAVFVFWSVCQLVIRVVAWDLEILIHHNRICVRATLWDQ